MRDKPDQVSGFRKHSSPDSEGYPSVNTSLYERFCHALPATLEKGLQRTEQDVNHELIVRVKRDEKNRTLWEVVKMGVLLDDSKESVLKVQNDVPTSDFLFNFDLDMD